MKKIQEENKILCLQFQEFSIQCVALTLLFLVLPPTGLGVWVGG
jgi:hypothetical protein